MTAPSQAVKIKRARICAFCGNAKLSGNAFCNNDYYALPRELRRFLFRPIGDGFEGAYETALEWLTDKYPERKRKDVG